MTADTIIKAPVTEATKAALAKSSVPSIGTGVKAFIMVATPSYYGHNVVEQTQALLLAQLYCYRRGVLFEMISTIGFSIVACARNWLVSEFLVRPEFTHLLWLDDDLCFQPDGIMKLIESDKDVIGGVYPTKHPKKASFPYKPIGDIEGNLQRSERVPTGFLLCKRDVVEAVAEQCPKFLLTHDEETREVAHVFDNALIPGEGDEVGKQRILGEDFVFTQRCIEAGFEVWARLDIGFSHIGRYAYSGKLSQALEHAKGALEAYERK